VPIRNVATAEDLLDALRWAVLEPGDETAEVEDTGPQAAIDAPSQVLAGGQVEVLWSGPEGDEDFLCLAPSGSPDDAYLEWARTEDGNPLVFRAPKEPGDYELRYVEGLGGTVLARVPLEVANIPVALRAATRVRAGRRFEVSWTGPASAGDFLSITKPGTHARHHFDWASTTTGSPITLAAPAKPGTYEIRYVVGRDREVLARFTIEVVE
jgi:Ca-activated chloride channel family protein